MPMYPMHPTHSPTMPQPKANPATRLYGVIWNPRQNTAAQPVVITYNDFMSVVDRLFPNDVVMRAAKFETDFDVWLKNHGGVNRTVALPDNPPNFVTGYAWGKIIDAVRRVTGAKGPTYITTSNLIGTDGGSMRIISTANLAGLERIPITPITTAQLAGLERVNAGK